MDRRGLGRALLLLILASMIRKAVNDATDRVSLCLDEPTSPSLDMFVDELPIPPVVDVGRGRPITLGAYKISQKLHRDLPSTMLYGFGTSQDTARYPGPTLEIGTDGGLLFQPQYLESILLASSERADVLVDFQGLPPGSEVFLMNSARTPTLFDKKAPTSHHIPRIPVQLLMNSKRWRDAATEVARRGSTEIWRIINLTKEAHPIHVHLVNFQVLDLQSLDMERYANQSCSLEVAYPNLGTCFLGFRQSPPPYLVGWKDTATILPGSMTRLVIRFSTREGAAFAFDATAAPGYLWHCHLLGHEDNEMMRPLLLT